MLNQKLRFGLAAIALLSVMIWIVAVPSVSALTPRDFSYLEDDHKTDRFPGGQNICGDQLCTPDQWSTMNQAIYNAQRNPGECASLKQWKECTPAQQTNRGQGMPSSGNNMQGMSGQHGNNMQGMSGMPSSGNNMQGMSGQHGNFTHYTNGNFTNQNNGNFTNQTG